MKFNSQIWIEITGQEYLRMCCALYLLSPAAFSSPVIDDEGTLKRFKMKVEKEESSR